MPSKFIKVIHSNSGVRFGVDTKGLIWEMQSGSSTEGYQVAVKPSELQIILDGRCKGAVREKILREIRSLQVKLDLLRQRLRDECDQPITVTDGGYNVIYRDNGAIQIGCVTADAKTVKLIAALVKKIRKR